MESLIPASRQTRRFGADRSLSKGSPSPSQSAISANSSTPMGRWEGKGSLSQKSSARGTHETIGDKTNRRTPVAGGNARRRLQRGVDSVRRLFQRALPAQRRQGGE